MFLSNINDNQPVKFALAILKRNIILITAVLFTGCLQKESSIKKEAEHQFKIIDSLRVADRTDTAIELLLALHNRYKDEAEPFLGAYYRIKAEGLRDDEPAMNIMADSAMAEFNNETLQALYPQQYFKVLITKGIACYANKKFNLALQYFYRAKSIPGITVCDESEIISRIGGIFFDQLNYRQAAQSWYKSYEMSGDCVFAVQQQKFGFQQGQLDNAGLAYERAGVYDSAAFCYFKDINLIETTAASGQVKDTSLNSARIVVYDNLGGLYLKRGMIDSAEFYLAKSTGINWVDADGITVPPLLKLVELYTTTGKLQKAEPLFYRSKQLLDRHPRYNPVSQVKWHKLYAAFLLKNNRQLDAYNQLAEYIRIKDSIDKASGTLMTLNVGKEFNTLQQQQTLNELKIKDKVNKIYLWAITVVVALSLVIIFLVYRNLKKSRKGYNDSIAQNQQLQRTLQELEDANKNYIRVMRVMAHDLRNPLGGITGIAGILLKDDELNAEQRHMLQLVESTGNHSMEMINELLNSGLAQENEPIVTEPHNIAMLLNDTVELLQFRAKEKRQTLRYTGNAQPIIANINREKMWRVFNNVIVNAIKFTRPGGNITVSINRQGNRGVISVTDDGVGIPDIDRAHVFDMFTPAKKTGTGGEKPFGLGLSISKRIIEKHNGKIWFESVEYKGTTFYIELAVAGERES